MFRRSLYALLFLLLSAPTAYSADKPTGEATFQSLSKLLVGGTWTRADSQEKQHTYKWMIEGKFMQRTAKGGAAPDVGVIGVDLKTQQCTWWFFHESGGTSVSTCTQEQDGVWLFDGAGQDPKGDVRYKGRVTRVDEDTLSEEVLEYFVNGKKQITDTTEFTWKRIR